MPNSKWTVAVFDGSEYVKQLLGFLLPEYTRIFGVETMNGERCIVFNDPKADCPMLITSTTPVMIRLAQTSTVYWAQTVYQLSHEMCHYAIRKKKKDKDYTLKWLEETICEAMSLYALEYAARNWYRCPLSQNSPTFSTAFVNYLEAELKRPPQDNLISCKTIGDLRICNQNAESKRDGRLRERNILYVCISRHPQDSRFFCDMYRYLNEDKLTIDFDTWLADNPSEIVRCLSEIQPKIIKE